jgi:maltooligosyltrehalose trehalohydrolase
MEFGVWAPTPKRVELVLEDERREMEPSPGGWWTARVEGATGPVRYGFALDDGPPLPDPRAPRLPDGVHALGETWDAGGFAWTDSGFRARPLGSGVIYELHIGTFTPEGTFDSTIERLDDLVELGVTHVELMPVNSFPGVRGWGYDGVGLFAPHEPYGGPEGLCRLVDACHARGLAVIIDVVYNHLGPEGNYLAQFGPYFTDRYHTPWGEAVNLDGAGSDEVRRFFLDNARLWLRDFHADGLRIDAIHAFADESAKHFLEEMAEEKTELEAETGRPLVLIAESDLNDPRVIRGREAHGLGMDAQWTDDFHHALHALGTGERQGYYADFGRLADVAKSMQRAFAIDGQYAAFRRRRHGRPIGDASGHRFVVYGQTHDQVGNRAVGDRIGHLVSPGRVRIVAALVLTSPYVPMLFMGEEWAASTPFQFFADYGDDHLKKAVRAGRRREFRDFGWKAEDIPDPIAVETFERSRLRWDERGEGEHAAVLTWYRDLIRLRHAHPELTDGRRDRAHVRFDEDAGWLMLRRGRVTVAVNFGGAPVELARPEGALFQSYPEGVLLSDSGLSLPRDGVAVVVQPDPRSV